MHYLDVFDTQSATLVFVARLDRVEGLSHKSKIEINSSNHSLVCWLLVWVLTIIDSGLQLKFARVFMNVTPFYVRQLGVCSNVMLPNAESTQD